MKLIEPISVTLDMITSSDATSADDPAAYNAATTYALDTEAAPVLVTDVAAQLIYRSRQAGNTGHTPASSPDWWELVGSANKTAMFDQRVSSQTTNADSLTVSIAVQENVSALILLNVESDTAQVSVNDPIDGLVFDQTQTLIEDVTDYDEYCFAPVTYKRKAVFLDLPPYPDATITLTLARPGNTVACGVCGVGFALPGGVTETGLEMGIDDYSEKSTSAYGLSSLVEGDYADVMSLTAWVRRSASDVFANRLTALRARPAFYVGASAQSATLIYGWPEAWRRVFRYPEHDVYSISFKSLT